MALSTFQLPSNLNLGNVGLSADAYGGITSSTIPQATQPANPINFGVPQAAPQQTTAQGGNASGGGTSSGGGSSGGGNPYAAAYYASGGKGDVPVGYHGNQSNTGIQMPNINFDSIYEPILSGYDKQTDYVNNTEYPQLQKQLADAQQNLTDNLTQDQSNELNQYNNQQGQFITQEDAAKTQLTRDYQAANQRAQALYGGGNGAGEAMNELAYQELQRGLAQLYAAHSTQLGNLGTAHLANTGYFSNQSVQIKRDYEDKLGALQGQQAQDLLTISNNRAATLSQKAQQIATVQSHYTDQINALSAAQATAQQNLQSWYAENTLNLHNQSQTYANQYAQLASQNPFSGIQFNAGGQQQSAPTDTTAFNPFGTKTDEFGQLVTA